MRGAEKLGAHFYALVNNAIKDSDILCREGGGELKRVQEQLMQM